MAGPMIGVGDTISKFNTVRQISGMDMFKLIFQLKHSFILIYFCLLVSCGGDGDGSSSGGGQGGNASVGGAGSSSPQADSEDFPLSEPEMHYPGKVNHVLLSRANTMDFINTLLTDNIELDSSGDVILASASSGDGGLQKSTRLDTGTIACSDGGSFEFWSDLDEEGLGLLRIHYRDCDEGGTILSGHTRQTLGATTELGRISYTFFTEFSDLILNAGEAVYTLTGNELVTEPQECGASYSSMRNMDVYDAVTGKHSRYENWEEVYPPTCYTSSGYRQKNTSIEGRLYLEDHGYVDVDVLFSESPIWFEPLRIHVEIQGAENTRAEFSNETIPVNESSGLSNSIAISTIQLDADGDGSQEFQFSQKMGVFELGVITDLLDEDGDGMLDRWEDHFGLDSQNPNDAALDLDADGFSNLSEHRYVGDPADAEYLPLSFDFSAEVRFRESSFQQAMVGVEWSVDAFFELDRPDGATIPESATVSYSVSNNAYFSDVPVYCEGYGSYMECSIDGRGNASRNIKVISNSVGDVTFTARVQSAYNDPDTSNNSASIQVYVREREANLRTSLSRDPLISRTYSIPYDGTIDFEIGLISSIPYQSEARNIVFQMSLPNGVEAVSGEYRRDQPGDTPDIVLPCETSTQSITCRVDRLYSSGATYNGSFYVTLRGTGFGEGEIVSEISSDSVELDPSDNIGITPVIMGYMLDDISLDSLDSNRLELDSGWYIGRLSIPSESNLIVTSVEGADVKIRGLIIFNDGASGVIENLHFTGNSSVYVSTDQNSEVRGHVVFSHNRIDGNFFFTAYYSSVIIEKNYFDASESSGRGVPIGILNSQSENYVRDNVFLNYTHDQLITYRSYYIDGISSLHVVNNTFSNVVNFLRYSANIEEDTRVVVANNIFNNVGTLFSRQYADAIISSPEIEMNLFWDVLELSSDELNFSAASTLDANPLFVNSEAGDYSVGPLSLAIDAGSEAYSSESDILGVQRPVDGNGDSISAPDIGAFEYEP